MGRDGLRSVWENNCLDLWLIRLEVESEGEVGKKLEEEVTVESLVSGRLCLSKIT